MILRRNAAGLLAMVLVLIVFPLQSVDEVSPTASGPSDQFYPAIYGNYVVYEDNRHGSLDIYGYDISESREFLITKSEDDPLSPAAGDQLSPAIYGDYIVWMDNREGNWDIYVYGLNTEKRSYMKGFPITANTSDQRSPAISKDYVVWEDNRNGNWDIYYYDLSELEEDLSESEEEPSEKNILKIGKRGDQKSPAIYEDIVVYEDNRNGNWDIYGYNISESREFLITKSEDDRLPSAAGDQRFPAIQGNYVVWMDNREGNWDIYGYDISEDSLPFPICDNSSEQRSPAIHSGVVVWHDNRHGNWDIYGYDLDPSSKKEFSLTKSRGDQRFPAIYKTGDNANQENDNPVYNYIVVWMDHRNYYWDIWGCEISKKRGCEISKKREFPVVTSPADQLSPAIYENYVVWQDNRIDNLDIYGYNIDTKEEFSIVTNSGNQQFPAIYKTEDKYIVVWQDHRNDDWDIYGYNLSTKKEFLITDGQDDQKSPAIYENDVVWEDYRKEDKSNIDEFHIYHCKISEEPESITEKTYRKKNPAIYGDYVVLEENREGKWGIYVYSISINQVMFRITEKSSWKKNPAIYKKIVVWEDNRNEDNKNGNWDIYGYDLDNRDRGEFQITTNAKRQRKPAIYGDIVVWEDNRNGNWDIYGYNLSTKKEFRITKDPSDQLSPAIYGDYVVWEDNRNDRWDIYGYNLDTKEEFPIPKSLEEEPKFSFLLLAILIAILVVIVIIVACKVYKRYPNLLKHEPVNPPEEKTKDSKFYKVDALNDPISRIVFGKRRNYIVILLCLIFLPVVVSILSGSWREIDIYSLPRENVVLLKEEVLTLPIWKEPVFILCCVTAFIIAYGAEKFFEYIPKAFKELSEDEIITKKENTREKVPADFNEELREFEKKINGILIYVPGALLLGVGLVTQSFRTPLSELSFVSWNDSVLFRANWIIFVAMVLSMFFMFGILLGKMFCVVRFMGRLNEDYTLELKPYDTDDLGGLKPFEQIWVNMSYIALPVLVDLIILFGLNHFSSTPLYPLGRFSDLILCCIVIGLLLIYPVWIYHCIVKAQKKKLLDDIECKIEKYYKKIEEALHDDEKDVEENWMKEIKKYHEIELKVKDIPSLPLTTYKETHILLIAITGFISLVTQYISYSQSFADIITSWIP